jgi:hypothetical protein
VVAEQALAIRQAANVAINPALVDFVHSSPRWAISSGARRNGNRHCRAPQHRRARPAETRLSSWPKENP